MKIAIEKIKIMDRIRKEINKIDELALDIQQNGLLNAVTVMPLEGEEYRLLAGLRRIKAAQSLDWTEIEANVVSPSDAESALRIEISENEQREPFTFSEKVDFGRLLEEIEKEKARNRMSEGGKGGLCEGRAHGPTLAAGRCRSSIGDKIGMSGRQYDRARYIAANAPPEVIEQLDKGERTIRGAYDELRAKEKTENPSTPAETIADKPKSKPMRQTEPKLKQETQAKPKTRRKKPEPLTKSSHAATARIPTQRPLSAQDLAAARKLDEYHALSPEGKIEDLQRQLRAERARAAEAESELSMLKDLHHNSVYHKDSIIESLKWQLEAASTRVQELEDKYEPGQHIRTSNLSLVIGGQV